MRCSHKKNIEQLLNCCWLYTMTMWNWEQWDGLTAFLFLLFPHRNHWTKLFIFLDLVVRQNKGLMFHVHQFPGLKLNWWVLLVYLSVFSVYIKSTFDQKSAVVKCSYIFLILLLYYSGLSTAEVPLAMKLKLRKFKMILSDFLMRDGKSTATKKGRPFLSDVEKQFQAKKVV